MTGVRIFAENFKRKGRTTGRKQEVTKTTEKIKQKGLNTNTRGGGTGQNLKKRKKNGRKNLSSKGEKMKQKSL